MLERVSKYILYQLAKSASESRLGCRLSAANCAKSVEFNTSLFFDEKGKENIECDEHYTYKDRPTFCCSLRFPSHTIARPVMAASLGTCETKDMLVTMGAEMSR